MSSVFVIINDWTDIADAECSEIVGYEFFESENDAWHALNVIAESYGVDLHPEDTSFSMEDHAPGLQFEQYYIQELRKG